MTKTGFHHINSGSHFAAGFQHNWFTLFGVFVARGHYVEVIAFGRVFRVIGA